MTMPKDMSEEAVARMLRAAWIADEPIPAAGSFDDIGPIMRKAWMATARAVLAWAEERAREAVRDATLTLGDTVPMCRDDEDTIIARVFGREEVRDA